jgi:hypothetical protein
MKLFLEIVGSVVAAVLGLVAYEKTGLYGAAEAGIVKAGLGCVIASWFVLNFRIAFHGK